MPCAIQRAVAMRMIRMAMAKWLGFILLVAICRLLPAQTPAVQAPSQRGSSSDYVLGPDDQIKIWALGMEELADKPFRINPSGDVDLPLAGQMRATGLTVEQLKAKLVERLAKELLNPQVSVEIVEFGSQPVSVMGAVNRPGVHQLRGRRTLAEVLSLAEGLRQDAGPHITISREIQYGPIPLPAAKLDPTGKFSVADVKVKTLLAGEKPAENIPICPHDVVTVPTAELVFVMGEVKKAGEVLLKDRDSISVLQALASADGLGPTPAPQDAKIVRMNPGKTELTVIPVDLRKIQAGKAEDIAMRPNDVLIVPPSGPKKAAARITEAAIQAATGIVIWRR
jgi:polysaccharide biosynthesis/export protein